WQAATVDLGPPHAANTADLPPQHLRGATPRLDDIEIISPLGSGGIGAVFAARQVSLDRMVAVKVLHPELARDPRQRERFRREAQMMARWHHPHIVRVYDFREADDGQAALLMELVDGERLGDMPSSALPPARLCAIGAAIADALAHAHAAGVVHRDVSPDNVLLRRDGTALLSDFGIALLSGARRLTGAALVLGKPRYMSPEQLRGGRDVPLAAADVYALGVLLYERLAGDAPFEHDTLLGLLMIKEAEQYEPLEQLAPQLPPALSRLVDRMLAADPDRRPSASEVARELAAIARP
ncbi:MAG: serine/threonine protein kinase, partial [Myxococcales bacterium]|nr:serine/threonine protein kinase [Myxococcales bacterium]